MRFTLSERTAAIAAVFRTVPLGGVMTFKALSDAVMFRVTSRSSHYWGARNIVLREGISIASADSKISFRRRTADEMAEGKHRFGTIRRAAKRGAFEAREALKSNDLHTQGKASIAAAKYALIAGIKPVSNKDVGSDLLPMKR